MNKIRLIILANNKDDIFQINRIIQNLQFQNVSLTVLYTNNNYNNIKSSILKLFTKIIFFIESKFINNDKFIKKKQGVLIDQYETTLDKFVSKKSFFPDMIIDLSYHKIKNNFLKKVKYGHWYFDYGVSNNFFIGFYECLFNKKIFTTFLIKNFISNNKKKTKLIDKYHLNNKTNFWLRNKQFILEKSAVLISKGLNKIYYKLIFIDNNFIKQKKNYQIQIKHVILYFIKKYFFYILKKINLFNKQKVSLWSLHFIKYNKNFFFNNKINFKNSTKINSPKNYEWADPFIIKNKNKNYIFFENNDLSINRGKISCGELKNDKLTNIKDILKFNYHMSYPFIWKFKKNFFLIPETSEKKSIHIWKAKNFPYQWQYFKKVLKNEYCCDTTIIKDNFNNNWLLTNKSNDTTGDPNNELYIYKIIGNFKKLIPHKLNPVITDCRIARNAGNLLNLNYIYRPSQVNNSSGYGIGLNINKILKIDLNSYKETIVNKIFPKNVKNSDGLHHINNSSDYIVFDIRYIL